MSENVTQSATLTVLDLFSGIGGFSLGLERTGGFRTIGFCEIDKKARMVLRKHWANVPIYEDITQLKGTDIGESVDVVCGGFPCQDISTAGKGAGLEGDRSGLWWQMCRIIEETQPSWAIIENVSALRSRGLDRVLGSLSEIGYDAEWHCIPASAVGAPHRRDRVWIVAYPSSLRPQGPWQSLKPFNSTPLIDRQAIKSFHGRVKGIWSAEPNVGRVANGVPGRVDRLKQLGNAVVPQIPELIGHSILKTLHNQQ